jgi:hypothetical protein
MIVLSVWKKGAPFDAPSLGFVLAMPQPTQIMKAVSEGYDVRGIYYWTLMDNFEWAAGYNMRFGLYQVRDPVRKRL